MRHGTAWAIVAAGVVFGILGCQRQENALVVVNGKPLTAKDCFRYVSPQQRLEAIDSAIYYTLLRAEAEKAGITITPEQVQEEMTRFAKFLKQAGYEGTLEDYYKERGYTLEEYQEMIELSLLQFELGAANISYSDEDLKRYLAEHRTLFDKPALYRVRCILVATKDKGEEIVKRLARGEKFEEIARRESLDRGTAERGGLLGEFTADQLRLRPGGAELLQKKVGEIVGPVAEEVEGETRWWILVNDRRTKPEKATLEKDREEIRRAFLQSHPKFQSPQRLHDRLFKAANIKFLAPGLDILQKQYEALHAKPTPLLIPGVEGTPGAEAPPAPAGEE